MPYRFIIALPLLALHASAEVQVPGIFSHNMVIQRDVPLPVWGTADPGEEVTVSFRGNSETATTGADGRWRVTLPSPSVTATPRTLRIAATNTLEFKNVLVGEVWLCAGQSNMAWPIKHSTGAEAAVSDSKRWPQIRVFRTPNIATPEPATDLASYWQVATPATVPSTSAVAYHFAKKLHTTIYVPIGIIQAAWGGSRAEAWIPRPAIGSSPDLAPLLEAWQDAAARWDSTYAEEEFRRRLNSSEQIRLQTLSRGETSPSQRPAAPSPPTTGRHVPGNIFNGMIAPIAPYPVRGFVWYQGESNAERAAQYATLFPLLIRSWRAAWAAPDLPFIYAQLPAFGEPTDAPGQPSAWAELQDAQRLALSLPQTFMAVTNDLGDADNIHPPDKKPLAERLAAWANHTIYKKSATPPTGPLFLRTEILPSKIRLHFLHNTSLNSSDGKPLARFEIAAADQKWHWADATIDAGTVLLSSPAVPSPVAARYAWASNPTGANLTNATGLPTSPFRTDNWPLWTAARQTPEIDYLPPLTNSSNKPD